MEGDGIRSSYAAAIAGAAAQHIAMPAAPFLTGGGLGARLTSVSGSSSAFLGGAITYSMVMRSKTRTVRYVEAHHTFDLEKA